MVRFTVLASGSKGNSTVITGGRTRILIDAGLSCRELFRRMKTVGEDPESLNAILITHEHADHVNGVAVTARRLGIPVYFTEATHRAWMRWLTPRRQMSYSQWLAKMQVEKAEREALGQPPVPGFDANAEDVVAEAEEVEAENSNTDAEIRSEAEPRPADPSAPSLSPTELLTEQPAAEKKRPLVKDEPAWLPKVEFFTPGEDFSIGDLTIRPFTTPHDAADPCGFVVEAEGVRMGYATDLGYVTPNVKAQLKNLDLLLLESNHDLEMLRDGPYPWAVKQRVLSRVGHLSNDATSEFLLQEYDGGARYVILAHLSENNNLPELARIAAERALACHGTLLANQLLVAAQQEPLDPLYF